MIPKGTRTAFRAEGEQSSERSDAGSSIVEQVFGFVKKNLSGAQRRQAGTSEERGVGKGVDCTPKMRHEVKGPNTLNGEVYGFGPENLQPRSEDRGDARD